VRSASPRPGGPGNQRPTWCWRPWRCLRIARAAVRASMGPCRALIEGARSRPVRATHWKWSVCSFARQRAGMMRASELARGEIDAGPPRPLPELSEPPWFPSAVISAVLCRVRGRGHRACSTLPCRGSVRRRLPNSPALAQTLHGRTRRGDLKADEAEARASWTLGMSAPPLYRQMDGVCWSTLWWSGGKIPRLSAKLEPSQAISRAATDRGRARPRGAASGLHSGAS